MPLEVLILANSLTSLTCDADSRDAVAPALRQGACIIGMSR